MSKATMESVLSRLAELERRVAQLDGKRVARTPTTSASAPAVSDVKEFLTEKGRVAARIKRSIDGGIQLDLHYGVHVGGWTQSPVTGETLYLGEAEQLARRAVREAETAEQMKAKLAAYASPGSKYIDR